MPKKKRGESEVDIIRVRDNPIQLPKPKKSTVKPKRITVKKRAAPKKKRVTKKKAGTKR